MKITFNSIMILEDDLIQAKALGKQILDYCGDLKVYMAANIESAMTYINSSEQFSAFFLDISIGSHTDNTDGLKFAGKMLHSIRHKNIPIIFVTGYPEHIFTAINKYHCYAYLTKPYSKKDVFRQLDNIFQSDNSFTIRTLDRIQIKLNFNDILYVQSYGRILYYTTKMGEYRSRQYNLKTLCNVLPPNFARCQKSYVINTKYIQEINHQEQFVKIRGLKDIIPLGREYLNAVLDRGD